jgi:hypothetical protein
MFGREKEDVAEEHDGKIEDVLDEDLQAVGADPAAVDLEPKPPEPVLPALCRIRIKRTGKVMTVSGVHAKILVDARRAEYLDV